MENYFRVNLTALRKAKKLTQQSIANQLGNSSATVGGWENGVSEPSLDTLIKLSEILSVTIDQLLTEDLSRGNLISNEQVRKNREKGNLKGNPLGNPNSQFPVSPVADSDVLKRILEALVSIDTNVSTIMKNK